MKIKLLVSDERYDQLERELIEKGFTIDEDADLILTEKDLFANHLMVKNSENNARERISVSEIIVIESYGHDIQISTARGSFKAGERLYQLEKSLNPEQFLRISNSVIVACSQIVKITPTLSSKFILTLSNGQRVDVTRSYYYIFRERLGI